MAAWPGYWPPFLWGAATSSHQIEGGQNNDWTHFEDQGGGRGRSGLAADHWHRWREDFSYLRTLGLNSYRLSLEWSRIEPTPGHFDRLVLDQYQNMIDSLLNLDIIPLVTLHHFTLPHWVKAQGGFLNRHAHQWFVRYVKTAVDCLGDRVNFYVTINEPLVLVVMGYLMALWPPEKHGFGRALHLIDRLSSIHRDAYGAIKEAHPKAWVGLAHHVIAFHPFTDSIADRLTARLLHYLMNKRFITMVGDQQDYIGINYYTRQYAHWSRGLHPIQNKPGQRVSDLGWEIYPQGLLEVVKALPAFNKPIFITENGIATRDEALRAHYLAGHLHVIGQAQRQGLDIRGYFHWSLLDNFEWAEGYSPRFGLVGVDYKTQQRNIKDSAFFYRDIIRSNQGQYPITVPSALAPLAFAP